MEGKKILSKADVFREMDRWKKLQMKALEQKDRKTAYLYWEKYTIERKKLKRAKETGRN